MGTSHLYKNSHFGIFIFKWVSEQSSDYFAVNVQLEASAVIWHFQMLWLLT